MIKIIGWLKHLGKMIYGDGTTTSFSTINYKDKPIRFGIGKTKVIEISKLVFSTYPNLPTAEDKCKYKRIYGNHHYIRHKNLPKDWKYCTSCQTQKHDSVK